MVEIDLAYSKWLHKIVILLIEEMNKCLIDFWVDKKNSASTKYGSKTLEWNKYCKFSILCSVAYTIS